MSKWINKEKFKQFQKGKAEEKDEKKSGGINRSELVWKTPEKGTDSRPKVYEGRFLPDKDGEFYKKYYYHMFKAGEKWSFSLCPKTFDFDNFCPLCAATSKLYTGSANDKSQAGQIRRKEKFVGNFYIVDDPRDNEAEEGKEVNGTVKLYEFPGKVEMKLKEEITDTRNGLGVDIFDPGDDGYNFILKVLSTKKDARGNVWPDYSQSMFARRSEALGTEGEIDKIMDSTHNLKEYVDNMKRDEEDVIDVLKSEMLYDIIEDDIKRNTAKVKRSTSSVQESVVEDDINDAELNVSVDDSPFVSGSDNTTSEDVSDEDLLRELEGL